MLSPIESVPDERSFLSILFDTSDQAQCQSLHDLRWLLRGHGEIEALDPDVFVLHVLPGPDQRRTS